VELGGKAVKMIHALPSHNSGGLNSGRPEFPRTRADASI
jgi:hypothetical protein